MKMDYYKMLFGEDIIINKNITLHTPSLGEIFEYGEDNYFSLLFELTATSYQLMLPLYESGIDYTTIPDYEIFLLMCGNLTQKDTSILFGDLDLSKLYLAISNETERKVLLDENKNVIIDEAIYFQLVSYIREMNGLKREFKIPGNEVTKKIYIREAKLDIERKKREKNKEEDDSTLLNIISSLCNHPGFKYNYHTVKNLSIYALFDARNRLHVYEDYKSLIGGVYAGTVDTKKIDSKRLSWSRSLKESK